MLRIGLTGGIGSGKSTVADYFKKLGVPVFDTDQIARDLVRPGQPALEEIKSTFGPEIVTPEGILDRAKLRSIVFADSGARDQLERILHPRIREILFKLLNQCSEPYAMAVIPLLIEKNWQPHLDRVLVVDSDEPLQRQRVTARDNISDDEIDAIMRSQIDRKSRLSHASDVIHNNSDLESLQKQVATLHQHYLYLSKQS